MFPETTIIFLGLTSILLTFKIHHCKYEVYNTAVLWSFWRFIGRAKVKIYHLKTIIWMELCGHSGYFLSGMVTWKRCANLFSAVILRFTVPFYNQRQQVLQRQQRPLFVCKLFGKPFRSMTLSWRKTLMKTLSSSLNNIVCYYLPNSDVSITSIYHAPLKTEELYVLVSKEIKLLQNLISSFVVHILKPNFVYSFQINWRMLGINGSFSLTRLLTMF